MRFINESAVRSYIKEEHKKKVSRKFLDLLNRKAFQWIEAACKQARAFNIVTEKDVDPKKLA